MSLVEQARLWRCPALGESVGFRRGCLFRQVREYLLDNLRIFDAGNDPDGSTAFTASLYINVAYKEVGKGREQGAVASKTRFSRCAHDMAARRSNGAFSSPSPTCSGLFPFPRLAGVTKARCLLFGANTPWNRVRFTLGLGTKAANRARKSRGSKIWCMDALMPW